MKLKRLLALTLSLCMTLSLALSNVTVASAAEDETDSTSTSLVVEEIDGSEFEADLTRDALDVDDLQVSTDDADLDESTPIRVLIIMEDESVLEADSSAVLNEETQATCDQLEQAQAEVISDIEETVLDGESLDVNYQYTWLLNGVAATVPYGAISEIKQISGVKQVLIQPVYDVCETTETTDAELAAVMDPMTISDGVMIGRESTWADGYTGQGMKIAIIDTGIDEDHQNFAALSEDKLTEDSATEDTIAAVLATGKLNASQAVSGLTADQLYRSSKIAYGFNYVDEDLDITHDNDTAGEHGTHVAGIAAANQVEEGGVVGVAPDAQLYIMKVFGKNGGAYTDDILAALEDALLLGADVINMSLGSPAGFTAENDLNDDENELQIDAIYSRVSSTGAVLCISAGNSATMGSGNAWGTGENLTSNPDNATVSSPSTYINALSVASMENAYYISYFVEANGYQMGYTEGSYGDNDSFTELAGQSFGIVAVPGVGDVEDFEGLDLTGKIALIQRGTINFADKCQNAADAGAVACLIYNNTSGTLSMDLTGCTATIPCAGILMSDGDYLISALEEDPDLQVTVGEGTALVASDTAGQMSDFSSWGVAPDLTLKPDITAPGGNIYSTLDGGTYGLMSGTSMASPNLAGISALVSQYVKATTDLTGADLHQRVYALLMSASVPQSDENGVYYSPRSQGSGLANAYNAVNTQAYLSVDGCDTPKAELGDDPDRTGSYSFSYDVTNFGDTDLFYDLSTTAQTENVDEKYAEYGYYFMSSTPKELSASTGESSSSLVLKYDVNDNGKADSHDAYLIYQAAVAGNPADANWTDVSFRYNTDGNETVDADDVQAYLEALVGNDSDADLTLEVLKVAAGETATVSVSVNLADADKTYFDTYYENGCYVEGYSVLTALNAGGIDLSLPYLGFYGGWDEAPVIDTGYYWGQSEDEIEYSQYMNILWTQYYYSSYWIPGLNPYLDEAFDESHISLSPNGDNYADYIDDMYLSLLRNANRISVTYTDADTGEVYSEENFDKVSKSYYYSTYSMCFPFVYSGYSAGYKLTDAEGNTLANNTKLTLDISAVIDYEGAESDVWEVPITVDTQAPVLVSADREEVDGSYYLDLTFQDNVSVAAVNFLNSSGTKIYAQYAADDAEATEDADGNLVWTVRYDVTGMGDHFVLALGDYALNESYYSVSMPGNDVNVDDSLLYAYRVTDDEIYDDTRYGWVGISVEDEDGAATVTNTEVCSSEYYMDYALTAAEQVGGYILAVDSNKTLLCIRPGYWDERTTITTLDVGIKEMTYDASTGTLYALTTGTSPYLVTIDLYTGELTYVNTSSRLTGAVALAADGEGNLYGIFGYASYAQLRTIDPTTGAWGETLLDGSSDGLPVTYYAQSMTYKDGTLYWAQYGFSNGYGELYLLSEQDDGSWSVENAGAIAGNAEVVGLLWLDTNELEWPDTELEGLTITPNGASLLVGGSTTLSALPTPWFCEADIEWTSSDPEVATVLNGLVTGVSVGTTVITASSGSVSATATINVVDPAANLNGFVISSSYPNYTLCNQWVNFTANDLDNYVAKTDEGSMSFTAAEYVDGVLYAYDELTDFYTVDPTDYSYEKIANRVNSDLQVVDLSYDYSTGYLYGLATDNYTTYLVVVDTLTGQFETVVELSDGYYDAAVAMAVDNDGTVYYVCDGYGFLCTYDVATGETATVGLTGWVPVSYIQSMTFDHDTGELYWASVSSYGLDLMYLDLNTAQALDLGSIEGGSQISGLYIIPENAPEVPYVDVESIELTSDSVTVLAGGIATAPVKVLPYNATDRTVTWTVADESIATIDNGVVHGVKVGTTTATGTINGMSVTLTINVMESVGAFRSFVVSDFLYGSSSYWCELYDYDIQTPGKDSYLGDTEYMLTAATYYDGMLIGYGEDYEADNYLVDGMHLQIMDAETYEVIADYTGIYDYYTSIADMTFDYTDGSVYAVGNPKNSDSSSTLYTFDLTDGSCYSVAALDEFFLTLACDAEGQLYGVNDAGTLYAIDKRTGELTEIGYTGYSLSGYQTMAFNFETGGLYWLYSNYNMWMGVSESAFIKVDVTDASCMDLGSPNAMLVGLYFPTENEPTVPDTIEPAAISLSAASLMINEGDTESLTAIVLPVSVRAISGTVTFTSSDPSVVTVDSEGNVTGVSAGKATITATLGSLSATCNVVVLSENDLLYAVTSTGWQATSLLKPGTLTQEAKLDDEDLTLANAAYNTKDGYVYAVDDEGYLWKMTLDLEYTKQIGDSSLLTQLISDTITNPTVIDLAFNSYDGNLYALVGNYYYNAAWDWGYYTGYYLAAVDLENGTIELTGEVPEEIGRPGSMTFNGADSVLLYDLYNDYVCQTTIHCTADDSVKNFFWAQQSLVADNGAMMYFSTELNRLFLVAADSWHGTGEPALYMYNPEDGTFTTIGDGAWTADVLSILLVEGVAPVTGDEAKAAEETQTVEAPETEPAETDVDATVPAVDDVAEPVPAVDDSDVLIDDDTVVTDPIEDTDILDSIVED